MSKSNTFQSLGVVTKKVLSSMQEEREQGRNRLERGEKRKRCGCCNKAVEDEK